MRKPKKSKTLKRKSANKLTEDESLLKSLLVGLVSMIATVIGTVLTVMTSLGINKPTLLILGTVASSVFVLIALTLAVKISAKRGSSRMAPKREVQRTYRVELNKEITEAIGNSGKALLTGSSIPFSLDALSALRGKLSDYAADLVDKSIEVSKHHRTDTVSPTQVNLASQYLQLRRGKGTFKYLGIIGGILLGSSLTSLLAMIAAGQFSLSSVLISSIQGLAGSFLIALRIGKE